MINVESVRRIGRIWAQGKLGLAEAQEITVLEINSQCGAVNSQGLLPQKQFEEKPSMTNHKRTHKRMEEGTQEGGTTTQE